MTTLPFYTAVTDDFEAVNQLIMRQLHSRVPLVEKIGSYIISAGGKRLRPLVVLLGARACGLTDARPHTLAAIIEFMHTSTLLHDDVVDTSELRRGRSTANALWGNAASVLVGSRSEEHTSELQSRPHLVCRLLLEKKNAYYTRYCRCNVMSISVMISWL